MKQGEINLEKAGASLHRATISGPEDPTQWQWALQRRDVDEGIFHEFHLLFSFLVSSSSGIGTCLVKHIYMSQLLKMAV